MPRPKSMIEPELGPLTHIDTNAAYELVGAIMKQACKDWKTNRNGARCFSKSSNRNTYLRAMARIENWIMNNVFINEEMGMVILRGLDKNKELRTSEYDSKLRRRTVEG